MILLKKFIKKSINKVSYINAGEKSNINFLDITDYSEAIYSRKNIYFNVSPSILFTANQFFFSHWHYHTMMVKEIIGNNDIEYDGSLLDRYYKSYQPKNLHEFYFINEIPVKIDKKDKKLLKEDINKYRQNAPWSDIREPVNIENIHENGLQRSHGTQHFGPVSREKGQYELQRLKNTYKSIKKHGYKPKDYGHIKGHFLKYNNQYRFLITNGIHRTAVLCALGYNPIPVTFEIDFPRVIDFNDVNNFPQVRNGTFSEDLACQIFLSYFNDNGTMKARSLDLL